MKTTKNLVWSGLLLIAMAAVIFYPGDSDAVKLLLLLISFLLGAMWLYASSWGCLFRRFIIAIINANYDGNK